MAAVLDNPLHYSKNDYISTASGNKVSKRSVLCGSHNIHIAGKSIIKMGVILRGDLATLKIGKCVIIDERTIIRPPVKKFKGQYGHFPITIRDHVLIGPRCVIAAAQIGSNVVIGSDAVIGKRCVIQDNSIILPGTVLPPDTTVPSFTIWGGSPGLLVGELVETAHLVNKEKASSYYRRFIPAPS